LLLLAREEFYRRRKIFFAAESGSLKPVLGKTASVR
jgi:hypothetical protein